MSKRRRREQIQLSHLQVSRPIEHKPPELLVGDGYVPHIETLSIRLNIVHLLQSRQVSSDRGLPFVAVGQPTRMDTFRARCGASQWWLHLGRTLEGLIVQALIQESSFSPFDSMAIPLRSIPMLVDQSKLKLEVDICIL